MKRFMIAVVLLASAMCQAQLGTTTQIRRGDTLPTTCGGGDIFMKSGSSAGFYFNIAAGTCSWVGPAAVAGLSDPGSNGIVKRTALNTTAPASASDIAGLFSGCSGTQYLGADGACHSPTTAGLADPGSNGIVKRTALNTTAATSSSDILGLWTGSCSSSTYMRGDGACATPSGSSTDGYVGPISRVTDSAFGVATGNTATQNQTAFAAVATAVNGGTTSPYVYIPAGTYNVLSTSSTALGSYDVPVTIHCENPYTTVLNISGSGNLVQFGASGLSPMGSTPYVWGHMRLENCKITGGGSLAKGVYVRSENWGAEIRDNFFYNFGGSSNRMLYGECDTWINFHHNRYLRDDTVTGNLGGIICGTSTTWSLLEASHNSVVSALTSSNPNTALMGTGFESDGHIMVHDNENMSGPVPLMRCGTKSSNTNTCSFQNNMVELWGSPGIQFGTVSGSSETVPNLVVSGNQVFAFGDYSFIGPANSSSSLVNATVTGNHLRPDSGMVSAPMVVLNNLSSQTGNISDDNTGWATLHTAGTNITSWTGDFPSVSTITGTSQSILPGLTYIANNASQIALSLPATSAVGEKFSVIGKGAGGWSIYQATGQTIHYGATTTSANSGCSINGIKNTNQYDAVQLMTTVADTEFTVVNNFGTVAANSTAGLYQTQDIFTGASGALTSHTDDCSHTWTFYSLPSDNTGNLNLNGSGGAVNTDATASHFGGAYNSTTPASADYTVSIDCTNVATNASCAAYGRLNTGAYTLYGAFWDRSAGNIQLFKVVAGSATQLGSTYTYSWSGTHTLALVMSGTSISVKLDGSTVIGPATDSAISAAGKGGFRAGPTSSVIVDNFRIQ